jgi:hypothetical protein
VLGQGIGRFSPTMAREKSKRRVHKDQLALAVRKNFNALGVTESDVIVDWLYKSKHQGSLPRPCEPPLTATDSAGRQRVSSTLRAATEMSSVRITSRTHLAALTAFLYDTRFRHHANLYYTYLHEHWIGVRWDLDCLFGI